MNLEQQLVEQKRRYADRADYLLELFGRTILSDLSGHEKKNALKGLLHNISNTAMDSGDAGQSVMNRAFHVAKSGGDQQLAEEVAQEALDCDFRSPAKAPFTFN